MTVVHLLRHGEVYNPDHILYGRLPGYQLSLRGLAQADIAAKFLAARPIGYVVSSPLERAQQTASAIADLVSLDVATDDRLIEAANQLEGTHVEGPLSLIKDVRAWRYFGNPVRPSWGEPYTEIVERVLAAVLGVVDVLDAMPSLADGRRPEGVCVSHQLPIYCLRRYVEGQRLFHDPRRRECALASVTSVTFVGHEPVEIDYAEPAAAIVREAVAGA